MRLVGIVETGLVSGSYYNIGGASDINGLKGGNSTWHSFSTSQRTPRAWIKYRNLREERGLLR